MEHVDKPDGLSYGEMVKRATTDHDDAPLVAKFEAYPVKKMRLGIGLFKRRNAAQEPEMVPDESMGEADFRDSEEDPTDNILNCPDLDHLNNALC